MARRQPIRGARAGFDAPRAEWREGTGELGEEDTVALDADGNGLLIEPSGDTPVVSPLG